MGMFNGMAAGSARFDRSSQHRRSMIAKVHIAKQQLGLADDDYRAVLLRVAGRTSAAECTEAELAKVLAEFAAKGFTTVAKSPSARPADHPTARKARALWISLHQLGAIDKPDEAALEAFARRQLKVERLQWAKQAQAYKLVEALKSIAERHGWSQSTEGVSASAMPLVLQRRLVEAIAAALRAAGVVPAGWSMQRIAFDLAGIELSSVFGELEELRRLAGALGAKLREVRR